MYLEEKILELNQRLSEGITPAMATPIVRDSAFVALDVVPDLVDFLVARGVAGLFVGGTTGEGILLDAEERRKLHEAALSAAGGRVPVLVHVGSTSTEKAVELSQHASAIGADAIVAVTPIFYDVHDDALAAYFQAIHEAAPQTPLFVYDIPHMANNGIGPNLAVRLFSELPSLAGMKSSNRDAQAIGRLLDVVPDGRILLAGNETIALGSLAMGASGMISGLATAVPEPVVAMAKAFFDGDLYEARRQQGLIKSILAIVPAGARIGAFKAILEARGVAVGPPVLPLPAVAGTLWSSIEELMSREAAPV
jgi:dihydrodipicolinate synthase/N-acetylneuraminate lyase